MNYKTDNQNLINNHQVKGRYTFIIFSRIFGIVGLVKAYLQAS